LKELRTLLPLAFLGLAGAGVVGVVAWVTAVHGPVPGARPSPGTEAEAAGPADPVRLRPLRVNSVGELERAFERRNYQWPPGRTVPPLAVQVFPHGLEGVGVSRKKRLFFRSLLPLVLAENARIGRERAFLRRAFAKGGLAPRDPLLAPVRAIAERYNVEGDLNDGAVRRRLLRRVDVVPPGLVLAQAANESAWGTSRFAREANNLFGHWTYDKDQGIVPRRRREGAEHFVRVFSGLRESVRAYLRNINAGHAYVGFRQMRSHLRASGQPLDPVVLAGGLERYSERGWAYVAEIRTMIRNNRLGRLNGVRLAG